MINSVPSDRHGILVALLVAVLPTLAGCPEQESGPDTDVDDVATDDTDADVTSESGLACESDHCVAERFRVDNSIECDGSDDQPSRCDVNPSHYDDWDPSSALTNLELTSSAATDCCFNLDGSSDGSMDNAFADLMTQLPIDVDRQLQAHLDVGTFVGLLEFQGLQRIDDLERIEAVNAHLGVFGSDSSLDFLSKKDDSCSFDDSACELDGRPGERFLVHPTTLDDGIQPEVHLRPVTVDGDKLRAGPGRLDIEFTVRGMGRHHLPIRGATVETTIDRAASEAGDRGVTVEKGRVGGYVLVRDLVTLLNGLVGHCDCMGAPTEAVTYPNNDPDDPDYTTAACERGTGGDDRCRVTCRDNLVEQKQCSQLSNILCHRFSAICLGMNSFVDQADLDTDGDGYLDAISFGARFRTTGANLDGVSDYLRVGDQTTKDRSNSLHVDRLFVNEPGWLAVYEPKGRAMKRVTVQKISAGHHTDMSVPLPSNSGLQSLMVVPYADDGSTPGSFEPTADGQLRYYQNGERISDDVQMPRGSGPAR